MFSQHEDPFSEDYQKLAGAIERHERLQEVPLAQKRAVLGSCCHSAEKAKVFGKDRHKPRSLHQGKGSRRQHSGTAQGVVCDLADHPKPRPKHSDPEAGLSPASYAFCDLISTENSGSGPWVQQFRSGGFHGIDLRFDAFWEGRGPCSTQRWRRCWETAF